MTHNGDRLRVGLSRRRLVCRIAGLGLAAAGLPLLSACRERQATSKPAATRARLPRIGMMAGDPQDPLFQELIRALADLGYVDGQTAVILGLEERCCPRVPDPFGLAVQKILDGSPDVVVSIQDRATVAARAMNLTLPIVMASSQDPVGLGFVASLARPGGNITGSSAAVPLLSAKRVELLKEVQPGLTRVAVVWNPENPAADLNMRATREAAATLGLEVRPVEYRISASSAFVGPFTLPLSPVFGGAIPGMHEALRSAIPQDAEALAMLTDAAIRGVTARIAAVALERRLATIFPLRLGPELGGLISYHLDEAENFRRAAVYVDKILKGARPADLPVERPTRSELVINMRTADALDLTIPSSVLALATEVIR